MILSRKQSNRSADCRLRARASCCPVAAPLPARARRHYPRHAVEGALERLQLVGCPARSAGGWINPSGIAPSVKRARSKFCLRTPD